MDRSSSTRRWLCYRVVTSKLSVGIFQYQRQQVSNSYGDLDSCITLQHGELKSGGHVTITYQILRSTFQAFLTRSLPRSDGANFYMVGTFHVQ